MRERGGYQTFRDREFGEEKDFKRDYDRKDKSDIKCFNCERMGHMARDCNLPKTTRGRRGSSRST